MMQFLIISDLLLSIQNCAIKQTDLHCHSCAIFINLEPCICNLDSVMPFVSLDSLVS